MEVKISVLVSPGAKKKTLKKVLGIYKFFLQAPPVDGKANQGLVEVLAEILRVPKSSITIVGGHSSKSKRLTINSALSLETIERLLDQHCGV